MEEHRDLLRLHDICLNYGQVKALRTINLDVSYGEVHAIVGEHGAGKSTLGKVVSGVVKPQSGWISFEGRDYTFLTTRLSSKLGIEMVYQQDYLYDHLSIAENIFLTNDAVNRSSFRNKSRILAATRLLMDEYGFSIDPAEKLVNLNNYERILVDILKHIYPKPKLLVLDEALEKLAATDQRKIIHILRKFKKNGTSVIFITHQIDDIYSFADRVSIINNGELLITDQVAHIDKINLIKMAYTQIAREHNREEESSKEFYELLKYNEAILQGLPTNLIVTDNANVIKIVNESCKQYFELHNRKYVNQPIATLFGALNADALEILRGALGSRESHVFYNVPLHLKEKRTTNNIRVLPIFDGNYLIGDMIVIEDITEYDTLQRQFVLSEKLASVGLLAAGVAHEINNPLEIMSNQLSYIRYNFKDRKLSELVDSLHEEVSNISGIVSNLMSFSDSEMIIREEFDANVVVKTIVDLMKHHQRRSEIRILFNPKVDYLPIFANKNEIKQVLMNLFKNSFEAMPSGGDIYIETGIVDDTNAVYIAFRDTGSGIGEANLSNIFLPFYSTKKELKKNNLGLGLYVTYGIIAKYRGTITASNTKPKGCEILITLPRGQPS